MELRLDVYDVSNGSLLGTLSQPDPDDLTKPSTHGRTMLSDLYGRGILSFTTDLEVQDDVDLLQPRRIVRALVDQGSGFLTVESFIIDDMPRVLTVDEERGIPGLQVSCQGLLGWLGYDRGGALLHPYRSVYGLQIRPRAFAWFAFDYDPETPPWATPDSLGTYANPTDPQLLGGAGDPGVNEVQRVVIDAESPPFPWGSSYPSPGGLQGTWRLVFRGVTTSAIQWDANAAAVKTALEGAGASIGSVTGSGTSGSPFVVTWDDETSHPLMSTIHDDLRHNHSTTGVTRVTAGSESVDGEDLIDGWPDANSVWYGHFGVDNHYRFTFQPDATQTGTVTIYAVTAGTRLDLWVDGEPDGTVGNLQVLKVENVLEATEHMIAVRADGPMMVTVVRGETVLWRTGSTGWIVHEGVPPGVTPGFAADRALSEAQSRGLLPWLDWDFDEDDDSSSTAWARKFQHAFRLQKLGRFIEDLAEVAGPVEARMTPTGTLQLFQRRGQDRTATVTVQLPFGASASGQGPRLTRALIETPEGLAEAGPVAEAEWGPMEDLVTFGTGMDPDELIVATQDLLTKFSAVRDEVDLELPDDVKPYVDVFLGDSVTVDVGDVDAAFRLTTFALADSESGQPEWAATGIPDG